MGNLNKLTASIALVGAAIMTPIASHAAGTISFGEDQYVSVGFGARASFSSTEDDDAGKDDRSSNFSLDSARLYVSGGLNKYIKGMFNSEKSGGNDTFQVIDAAGIFQVSPDVQIWAGRFLSPSSRANMAGPYYSSGDGYWASVASRYGFNGGIIGRDEGVAIVGSAADGRFGYSFGAFEGSNIFKLTPTANVTGISTSNSSQDDELMYAGRLQYAFWDKEPGYYGTGNYLGSKDILTVGIAARTKGDGAATTTAVGDYSQWTIDFLLEKKLEAGAVSLEAAYFDYDTDNVFLAEQGDAYYASVGFIFAEKMGWGQLMPFLRNQSFDADSGTETERTDFGVNYIIDGYNASITAVYRTQETTGSADKDSFAVTTQLQF